MVPSDSSVETAYQKIQLLLESSADRPAKPGRFEIFNDAVRTYLRDSKTQFPENGRDVFLIAGTNGKGSVAKTLETLLSESGTSCGLFTSPHLMDATERIRSHGRDLSREEFVAAFQLIETHVSKFELSHFEILTLMMIEVFFGNRVRPSVETAVIEVGVGGRLDPTRVVPHEYSVITRIGLDHEAILGPLPSIAREKFAIAEGSRVVIHAPAEESAVEQAFQEARRKFQSAQFIEVDPMSSSIRQTAEGPSWTIRSPWGEAKLSLLGERAVFNTSIALTAFEASGRNPATVLQALKRVAWPARMERLHYENRAIYLSGDHNPQGVQSLKNLLEQFEYESLWLVVGIGKNKNAAEMIDLYRSIPKAKIVLTLTPFRSPELSDYETFKPVVENIIADPLEALRFALGRSGPSDLAVMSGSLYLVGSIRSKLISQNR